jgi:hypothetical protein
MTFEILAQSGDASFFGFLQSINPDVMGAVMILAVIGTFVAIISISITLIESRKKITLAKLQKETVSDLLDRGYKLEDVERIVFGQSGWDKFCGIFHQKPREDRASKTSFRQPVPPNKQAV